MSIGALWAVWSAFCFASWAGELAGVAQSGAPTRLDQTTPHQDTVTQLLFPFYRGDAANFSGFAVSNHSTEPAGLQIEALSGNGGLLFFADNPHVETIGPGGKIARLGTEIFGIPMATFQDGWVRMLSPAPEVAGFFLFGNGLNGPLSRMDGSIALLSQSKSLFFTRLYEGPAVFPTVNGPQNARTTISVANPNSGAIRVRFDLFSPVGQPVAPIVERTIPGLGFLRLRLSTLMGTQFPVLEGYLRAEVTEGAGAIGFELVELNDSIFGFDASHGNPSNSAYSAQLASGAAGDSLVFTSFKIVNVSSTKRLINIFAYGQNGLELSNPIQLALEANQSIQRDVFAVFAAFSALGPVQVGSLAIHADGPGVVGDVVFGDIERADYVAALPLQTKLARRAVFSQVANGNIDPLGDPRMDTFTGVALFNPGSVSAAVDLRVFDRVGQQVGSRQILLLPRRRVSDLIASLVPKSAGLIGGYVTVDATAPIVLQELFGNAALTFMSAVPPHIVQ